VETNHLALLTTVQRNHLHSYLVAERERYRMAGEPLQMLRIDQRLSELARSHGAIALDRHEYAAAMQLEAA
jgi:hypothetical protein